MAVIFNCKTKGTGKKGGMMSVFLMGCFDTHRKKWVTVTKVHTGHDDNTLEKLQKELTPLMIKISQDNNRIPSWLDCNKGMVPDFIAADPEKQPVWEITGTELTKANLHTADGISVRFPRVTRIRNDKDWKTATNLDELKHLYKTSKEKTDVSLLNKLADTADDEPPVKKVKASPSKRSPVKAKISPKTGTIDNYVVKKKQEKSKDMDTSDSSNKTISDIDKNEEINMSTDEIDSKEVEFLPENPLPDIFKYKKLGFYPDFISFPEDERKHFERHWIAYGGTVIKSIRDLDVDYLLHNKRRIEYDEMKNLKRKLTNRVKHVHKDWLMKSINDVKLCDTTKFFVNVKP